MRERLKELWQQARVPASTGVSRLAALTRRLGRWIGREASVAGRALARGLTATFSWGGGFLALRWILLLTVVAGLGFFLGRARPDILPTMPWETAPLERVGQSLSPGTSPAGATPAEAGSEEEAAPVLATEGLDETLEPAVVAPAVSSAGPATEQPTAEPAARPAPLPSVDLSQMAVPVVGSLGESFVWRRDGSTRAWRLHDGIDLVAPPRQPVTAALPGRVSQVSRASGGGISVWVDHAGGWSTRYGFLSESFVVEGQQVAQGQAVGRVGRLEDGTSLGVHFAVYRQGQPEDPLRFLPALTP